MKILLWLSAAGVLSSISYYAAAVVLGMRFARRAESLPAPLPKIAPRAAILKPLRGLTTNLPANVISYLELDYPRKEYVFGVSGYDDAAAGVPLGLKGRYQFHDIALVIGEEPDCANHKVAKLIRMFERAPRAEIIVVSDADIAVERDHLRRVVGELTADARVGIVTCLYRAVPTNGLGSRMESLFVNTDFAPMAIVSEAIEPIRHAFGATITIKRSALEAIGGFKPLKNLLADDFFLGRMVAEKGNEIRLSSSVVTINAEERSFADFWVHQLRWARTYRTVRPVSLARIIIDGPFWALMMLVSSGFQLWAAAVLLLVLVARTAMAAVMLAQVFKLPQLLTDLWLMPIKDLVMTAIWFASLAGNEVVWGGRRFRLLSAGRMEEVRS
jgi:ceramide glucosyltransferase